jgi:hypothetical protein
MPFVTRTHVSVFGTATYLNAFAKVFLSMSGHYVTERAIAKLSKSGRLRDTTVYVLAYECPTPVIYCSDSAASSLGLGQQFG